MNLFGRLLRRNSRSVAARDAIAAKESAFQRSKNAI
jgi:hypothetical protein